MSSPFGEPPKGLNLEEDSTGRNDAVVVCMYALAFVTIGFRLFSRIKVQQASIGLDDWLIVGALLSGTANMACAIAGGHYGLGKHVWVVTLDEIINMVHILYANVLLYILTVPLIKVSIILSYRRLFGMQWTMWACIALSIAYWIGCSVAFLCSCQPVSYFWTQYENPLGGYVRYDIYPFYIAHAVANMAGDLLILLVPIPLVWRLKLRVGQKIQILSIFLLGGFVCVASAIRIYYFTFINDVDVTWNLGNVFIWSSVEPSIGIVCACLPVLQPLFRTIINRRSMPNRPTTKGVRFAPDIMSKIHGDDRKQTREDEAVLTTTSVHIEMDGVGKGRISDEEEAMGYDIMSIKVQKDFQMEEEHRR
ncbi:hypothetical protein AtubIFM55763_006651 [Aspergillus tubingensis]|uniref:Rhodopsin domain-containing protein n=3 Tax=Aspergillus subgen. Circumdati TaxID=2720871 RepID=A0A1L9NQS6_ASPTC|nr:integral membrane protein Pth11-like protein [Aspergillus tubingensis]OJI91474.1 hypothetical protein ASPTUDRAFT_53123 [Aspergillus tubingensis CBS 134.48]GAQ45190.1 integral membrane protein Pth11-like [Aspergillus niger]GFN18411.1 integral membrane protein Pth11-like protein [Aspergillus tubingensis]GLA60070.1 hypothetical protein AtubIFM54640_011496 [Aspergillus tubingensis]GLA75375.1 hypothetical protein AtubIFM55763_006651 [Aspergillus tubingensis]